MRKIILCCFVAMGVLLLFPKGICSQWVQTNGPNNGSIYAFAVSDSNLCAGTDHGVYLSNNNGMSWSNVNSGYIRALAVSKNNLFAGTYGSGVYLSSNYGTSWTAVNTGLSTNDTVMALAIADSNIFAGTFRGVFLSRNNGASWTPVNSGLPTDALHREIYSLAVSGKNVFAGPLGRGVYFSSDSGKSWVAVNNGLPATPTVFALTVIGTSLFAGTDYGIFLYNSTATNWTAIDSGLPSSVSEPRPWAFSFALSGNNLFSCTDVGIFLFNNTSSTWTSVSGALPTTPWGPLAVKGDHIFTGVNYYVWTRPLSEIILLPPEQVKLLSPLDTAKIQADSVLFRWEKPKSLASRYQLQVATDSAMNFSFQDSTITDTTRILKSLNMDQTYWWRVRAYNTSGWGPFSSKRNFEYTSTVVSSKSNARHIPKFNFSEVAIQYSLPIRCFVSLRYYDATGKLIVSLVNDFQTAGQYALTSPLVWFADGMYFQSFRAGDYIKSSKVIVVR